MSMFHYGFMQVPSVPNQPKTAEISAKTHQKCIKNAHRGNHKLKIFSGEIPRTPLTRGGDTPFWCSTPLVPKLVPSALALTSAGPLLITWRRACILKHIWIGEKNNNKNCMILHCKNAEMTILSFLHFYSVKSYNFCYFFLNIFFLNLAVFYIEDNKKVKNIFFIFF